MAVLCIIRIILYYVLYYIMYCSTLHGAKRKTQHRQIRDRRVLIGVGVSRDEPPGVMVLRQNRPQHATVEQRFWSSEPGKLLPGAQSTRTTHTQTLTL